VSGDLPGPVRQGTADAAIAQRSLNAPAAGARTADTVPYARGSSVCVSHGRGALWRSMTCRCRWSIS
jgi:hypothetical protein